MAQQSPTLPQQPPQRFSPYPPVQSPASATSTSGIALPGPPPAKRQRLSPNPPSYVHSPYATSPTTQHISLPGTPGTPGTMTPSFHQPPSHPMHPQFQDSQRAAPGSMGPPQRPVDRLEKSDRATDINDLSDAVLAAGVNLREEEDYLTAAYQNHHATGSQATSFNSQSSATISPQTSFTQWSQGASQLPAFQGSGIASQKAVAAETAEEELVRKHKIAAKALADHQQYHLNEPFLILNVVRHKLHKRAYEHGVSLNVDGLFDKIPETPSNVKAVAARAPDGSAIASLTAPSLLERNAALVDVLALLSLATQERVRGVMEDAYTLSRSRQTTATGVVPPDFADIAVGNGDVKPTTALPTSLTGTSWDATDSAGSHVTTAAKHPRPDSGRLPTPPTDPPLTPKPTISFPQNPLISTLKRLREEDREFEKKRLEARAKRLRASTASAGGLDGGGIPSGAATPVAESIAIPAKLTKKERDRLTKQNESAETLHKSANETAALALGASRKRYSWMTGGKPGSGASTPRLNTNVGGKAASTPSGGTTGGGSAGIASSQAVDPGMRIRGRKIGDWREDRREGRGVQIRDVVHALELDGREKKTLVRVLARLKSDDP